MSVHPEIVCVGRVNGMGEAEASGAYVKIVMVWPNAPQEKVIVSCGAAEVLVAEIQGTLLRT